VSRGMGGNQTKLHGCTNLDFISLGPGVPCSHRCLWSSNREYFGTKSYQKMQPIDWLWFQLLNHAKWNYMTIEREALAMAYALHKLWHYLLGNKFIYLCGPHDTIIFSSETSSFRKNGSMVTSLLGIFFFFVVYKPRRFHSMANALFQMPNLIEQKGVLNQTTNVIIFLL
jgi:hypothetical protein